jgi:hypothetical protein
MQTIPASVNGVTGLLEGYHVFDLATEYKFKKNYNLKAGINNVFNEQYTTRRASGLSWTRNFTWRRSNILPFSWGKILIRHYYKKGFQVKTLFFCSNKV